jgi:hypothetical protein
LQICQIKSRLPLSLEFLKMNLNLRLDLIVYLITISMQI